MSEQPKLRKIVLPPREGFPTRIKPRDITTIKGHFLGHGRDQKGKVTHKLRTSEGDVEIYSAFKLDELMEMIQPGDYVIIEGKGKIEQKNGNTLFLFDLSVDENVPALTEAELAEVQAPAAAAAPAPRKSMAKVK